MLPNKVKILLIFLLITTYSLLNAQQKMIIYIIQSEPLGFTDANGNDTGIHYEIMKEVFKRANISYEIKIAPKARVVKEVIDGLADAGCFFQTPEADEFVLNAGVFDEAKIVAINRKGMPLTKYEDLYKSNLIGLMPNMSITKQFDEDANLKKNVVNSYETMMKLLTNNRIDTIVGNLVVLYYQLKINKLENNVENKGVVFKTMDNVLWISKKSPFTSKIDIIKEKIEEVKKDGTVEKIVTKYAGRDWKKF